MPAKLSSFPLTEDAETSASRASCLVLDQDACKGANRVHGFKSPNRHLIEKSAVRDFQPVFYGGKSNWEAIHNSLLK